MVAEARTTTPCASNPELQRLSRYAGLGAIQRMTPCSCLHSPTRAPRTRYHRSVPTERLHVAGLKASSSWSISSLTISFYIVFCVTPNKTESIAKHLVPIMGNENSRPTTLYGRVSKAIPPMAPQYGLNENSEWVDKGVKAFASEGDREQFICKWLRQSCIFDRSVLQSTCHVQSPCLEDSEQSQ